MAATALPMNEKMLKNFKGLLYFGIYVDAYTNHKNEIKKRTIMPSSKKLGASYAQVRTPFTRCRLPPATAPRATDACRIKKKMDLDPPINSIFFLQ